MKPAGVNRMPGSLGRSLLNSMANGAREEKGCLAFGIGAAAVVVESGNIECIEG